MKLFYRKLGAGKPLIILHGLFGMSDNWLSIAKRIAKKHTVYILDQRNHGLSPHSPEFNYNILSSDLSQFITEQGLDQVRLIGHSLGGKVGMKYALRFPEKVEKLVVVDIAPRAYQPSQFVLFLKTLLKIDLKKAKDRSDVNRMIESKIPQLAIRQFLLKNLKRNDKNELVWKINLQSIFNNIDRLFEEIQALGSFKRDALFIKGGMSDYINAADYPLIERLFPVAQVITIPLASHWVHSDTPDELCDHLRRFFIS